MQLLDHELTAFARIHQSVVLHAATPTVALIIRIRTNLSICGLAALQCFNARARIRRNRMSLAYTHRGCHLLHASRVFTATSQLVWRASRQALLQEIAKAFSSRTPAHDLFRLLAEYLAQQWLMFDPEPQGCYVPVPVTWSKVWSQQCRP